MFLPENECCGNQPPIKSSFALLCPMYWQLSSESPMCYGTLNHQSTHAHVLLTQPWCRELCSSLLSLTEILGIPGKDLLCSLYVVVDNDYISAAMLHCAKQATFEPYSNDMEGSSERRNYRWRSRVGREADIFTIVKYAIDVIVIDSSLSRCKIF